MRLPTMIAASLVLTATVQAADKPAASGTFEYNGKKYSPVHAVAFAGAFTTVVLSDKPFDPALGKDGSYNDSDLMAHPSASMTIMIDAERREFYRVRFRDDRGSGADLRCEDPAMLKLEKMDASGVAGTFKCLDHDVKFVAPMLSAPKS
jgi:hypothetical protein